MARYFYRPGHPKASANGFVSQEDMGWEPDALAKNAPIMMDRHYENMAATDAQKAAAAKAEEIAKKGGLSDMVDKIKNFIDKCK